MQFPKKIDYQETMDYKGTQIAKSQANKENSIKIASCGRDAVLIATTCKPRLFSKISDEEMKEKILAWRKWLWEKVYTDNMSKPF